MNPYWNQPVHACLDEPVKNGPDNKVEYFIEAKKPMFATEVTLNSMPMSVTVGVAAGTLAAIMILPLNASN
uniref:Uncharacterized protein n=1 Tax=Ditylenchus dipsaci TaxID=166011 RepID=A0A915E6X3_9BILA